MPAGELDGGAFGLRWPYPLPAYQQAGIERLTGGSALLADEMGLGKTVQAIGALRVLGGEAVPALVVAPAGLVRQWRAQLRVWAPELRPATALGTSKERQAAWRGEAAVYLTSYDSLCNDMRLPELPRQRAWAVWWPTRRSGSRTPTRRPRWRSSGCGRGGRGR